MAADVANLGYCVDYDRSWNLVVGVQQPELQNGVRSCSTGTFVPKPYNADAGMGD